MLVPGRALPPRNPLTRKPRKGDRCQGTNNFFDEGYWCLATTLYYSWCLPENQKIFAMHELRHYGADDDVAYNELFRAARDGNIRRLEEALQPSSDVNALQGPTGLAPLHVAAVNGHIDAIHFLLRNGADVDLCSLYDGTALNYAASGAHPEAVQIILDAGAQTSVRPAHESDTPLYSVIQGKYCVSARQIETIQLLLDRGFDINAPIDSIGTRLVSAHRASLFAIV